MASTIGHRPPSRITAGARIRRCPVAIGVRVPRGCVAAITTVSCTRYSQCTSGALKTTRTYLTKHRQGHHDATLHSYSLRIFRGWGDAERTSLEGRDEGTAFSCWNLNRRVHDGQHPLRQHSRLRRNMLWPQGHAQMQILNWRRRRYRRFLCWVPQFESEGVQRKCDTDQTKR
jgi:hypothetical protein